MDDLLNRQPTASEPRVATPESSPASVAPVVALGSPPSRTIDADAWVAGIRGLAPWFPLQRIAAGKLCPLLWGGEDFPAGDDVAGLDRLMKLQRAIRSRRWKKELTADLATWLENIGSAPVRAWQSLEAVAWAYALPALAKDDTTDIAGRLLVQLIGLADRPLIGDSTDHVLQQLRLKLELPLVLAHFTSDTKLANSFRKAALGAEARLASGLDPLSFPKQARQQLLRPWLATLVRANELLRGSEVAFSETAQDRLERLGRNALRLSRPDGSSILHTFFASPNDRELMAAAAIALPSLYPLAKLALGKPPRDAKPPKGLLAAPQYSPTSSFAILRNRWTAPATQATVDFSGPQPWLDLSSGDQSLVHGPWTATIRINDQTLAPTTGWSEVCWHSDADCDYLEIEQKLSGGWLLQRHLLLVRRDEALLVADSLLKEHKLSPQEFLASTTSAPRLEYTAGLQLAPGVVFAPQKETREGHLVGSPTRQRKESSKPLALVLPLALPEWRKQPCPGELGLTDNSLTHSLRASARNLFAPLWIDLNPHRFHKAEATWRQLTIGESLAVQPREVAVGYRVQVHYSQWLLYRSLAWRGNRTVLGKNFATDFACCRFHPNGEVDEILEVQ